MQEATLKEKAYVKLREWLMNGHFTPGEFLTERNLVEKLEMSRTPIRAALERLEAEGHVSYTPNKGIFVKELSIDKVIHFYDFRIAIESFVAKKLAGLSLSSEQIAWFEDNLSRQKSCVDNRDYALFTTIDSEFHLGLANLYGNLEIVQTMERLQDRLYQIALKVLQKDITRIQISYENHLNIFKFITNGDADGASTEMTQHLEYGKRILLF
ncbi:GntR family transcriptional regulator [Paenibacillus psychroresistens]|uniref:GntR family transcriptional regulator n=1 Tax=Paenibacillus psychroresistens TaxID=1778678 RepID=A0A6B8RHG8_9BACL|nr:GntR family transcriptional regulator [Paenibacillus psychroresistens]QGQ94992.1 GntR family transcriptional regulator [Paenibacillus psychroresistens]